MAADVDPNLIRQTKEALTKHIKKPPLHDKFLKKPPFRFLQDIVKSVVKETKFSEGKFSEQDFENAKDRETKIKFLDTVIAEIESVTGKKVGARPAKIVAGLDVNKTLELLILLGKAVDKTSDLKSKKQTSDKVQNEKKPGPEKEGQKKDEEKKANKKPNLEAERDGNRKVSDRNQETKDHKMVTKSSQRVDTKDTKQSTMNRKNPSKPKEDEKKPSPSKKKPVEKSSLRTKDEPPQVDSKKTENDSNSLPPAEDTKTKNKNENSQVEQPRVIQTAIEDKEKTETKSHIDDRDKNAASTEIQNKNQGKEQTQNQQPETKKPADTTKEQKKTEKEIRKSEKPASAQHRSDEPTTRETSGRGIEKRISTTLERTDSGRIMLTIGPRQEAGQRNDSLVKETTRPLKLDVNKRVFTPEKTTRQHEEREKPVNIFTENQNDKDDADDMYILETQYVPPTNSQVPENKGEFKEQGQLVSQIIDTKKQLESKETESKTKIQWEESATWRRNTGEKEVGGVKTLIQQLTKNAGPLGQLLAGLQEDTDEMVQELAHWRQINVQLAIDMKKEKELTDELIKPLVKQLEELEQTEYPQEMERVKAARAAVYANDKRIEELLESRTK